MQSYLSCHHPREALYLSSLLIKIATYQSGVVGLLFPSPSLPALHVQVPVSNFTWEVLEGVNRLQARPQFWADQFAASMVRWCPLLGSTPEGLPDRTGRFVRAC